MAEEVLRAAHARRLTKGNNHNSVFPHDACVALYLSVDMCVCVCVYTMHAWIHSHGGSSCRARAPPPAPPRTSSPPLPARAATRACKQCFIVFIFSSYPLSSIYYLFVFCIFHIYFLARAWKSRPHCGSREPRPGGHAAADRPGPINKIYQQL